MGNRREKFMATHDQYFPRLDNLAERVLEE
jgi:hypothetical protein